MTTTTTLCGTCIHRTVCKIAVKQQPTFCSQHYFGNCSESITYTERAEMVINDAPTIIEAEGGEI